MAISSIDPRPDKFLEALPKHKWKVEPAALEAGYSASYARHNQKLILQRALKRQAQKALELSAANHTQVDTKDIKKTLADLIGMDRESVFKRLKEIATQDKDLNSALKVLAPLAKELGVPLNDDQPKTIVPILNIGIRETAPPLIEVSDSEHLNSPPPPIENG